MQPDLHNVNHIFEEGYRRGFRKSDLNELIEEYRLEYRDEPKTLLQLLLGVVS